MDRDHVGSHVVRSIMKTIFTIAGAALILAVHGALTKYFHLATPADGSELVVTRTDGSKLSVPKSAGQDAFDKAAISDSGRYVGWLALSNLGDSYPQPLGLDVLDTSNRIQHFRGDFGMVSGWCFGKQDSTVTYTYSFPHGVTPIGFDMRRLNDGKLLRRFQMNLAKPGENDDKRVRNVAPSWTLCAWNNARNL
jgi:hypothetical protein